MVVLPSVCGRRPPDRAACYRKGETDLVYRHGQFYLLAVCVVDEPTPQEVDGVLGVDWA